VRRRLVVPAGVLFPEPERPAPTYPEYAKLLEDATAAAAADGQFVDPVKLRKVEDLRRPWDWKLAVLGREPRGRTVVEMHMLLLAHERDLDPPLPQWVLDARAEAKAHEDAKQAARKRRDDADQAAWDAVLQQSAVRDQLEVLRNGHARARYGYSHNLGHVVPKVDMRSGTKRRHRAGRGLCETETRSKPLDLTGGEGGPATCVSCLNYVPKIRPAAV
jgi:hypothetical protein